MGSSIPWSPVAGNCQVVVSEIGGNEIIRASAPANIEPGSCGTDQITVSIERAQESRFIGADVGLNAPQCIGLDVE